MRWRAKRRPKTGNLPWVKQWFYIHLNFPYFWTVKIGVTGYYWSRWWDITTDSANPGFDIPIFGLKCYFAYDIEQWNKRRCNSLRVHYFRGTGRTERFNILAMIPAVLAVFSSFAIEWLIKLGFFYFVVYTLKENPYG